MNTTHFETEKNLQIAVSYYEAMIAGDFERMATYLHEDVHFIGPLDEMHEKDAVIRAAKGLCQTLDKIHIRSKFAQGNQIMMVYDFLFPAMNLNLRASVLMGFKNSRITKIELFYDARPFEQKKDEIFTKKGD